MNASEVQHLRDEEGLRPSEIAARLGLGRTTVWRALQDDDYASS